MRRFIIFRAKLRFLWLSLGSGALNRATPPHQGKIFIHQPICIVINYEGSIILSSVKSRLYISIVRLGTGIG